jgi:hypothetical protein
VGLPAIGASVLGVEISGSSDQDIDAAAVVRVLDRAGDVVGAGFLVGRGLVATCAHVVTSAVGGDPTADDAPRRPLSVDFPLVRDPDSDRPVTATGQVQRGAVALCEAGAGEIVDPGWSDRQGQLVEGGRHP